MNRALIVWLPFVACVGSTAELLAAAPAARSEAPVHIDTLSWPTRASGAPSPAEWTKAETLLPTRATGERARQCRLGRVREWLRISCGTLPVAAITQLGGDANDTQRSIGKEGADRLPGGGTIDVRLAPASPRAFTFWTFGPGYDGPLTVVPAIVVQTAWPPAQAVPTLILNDALYEPVPTGRNP